MNTIRNSLKRDYSQIPNELITDLSLSHGALRVLLYLFTKPDNWNVYNKDICKQLNISQNTLTKYWKELLSSKWLRRERKKDESGKFIGGNYFYEIGNFTVSPIFVETEETIEHSNNNSIKKEVTNNIKSDFEQLWGMYDKKKDKKEAFNKYSSKSFQSKYKHQEVHLAITRYLKTVKDKQYQKHFKTFLNNISDWLEDYEEKPSLPTTDYPNINWNKYNA